MTLHGRHISLAALVLALTALLSSCAKQEEKTTYDNQETLIESFVSALTSANTDAVASYHDGPVRVTVKEGSGEELSGHGVISFYYAGYILTSTTLSASGLFWTNHEETAVASGWSITDPEAFGIETLKIDEADLMEGLRLALPGVRGGEECYILFSGKYAYGNKAVGTIPARSALAYHIWVDSISNE